VGKNIGKFVLTLRGKTRIFSETMGAENELVDWEQLDMMADGYTPDFVEIYREFLDQTPELLDVLEKHFLQDDVEQTREAAHKAKGSAANFGFVGVSVPMSRLELQAKEAGNLDGARKWVQEARENFERSKTEIHEKRGI
jgi:HPt (histidine-containing phosphotransfer) domain-containing protein